MLPGVSIGNGAVIGVGAVLAMNLTPYAVAVGTPATESRKIFSDDIISLLEEIKWWNWPEEKIHRNKVFFQPI